MNYAEVAVNSPLTQPRTFSYSIPPNIPLSVGHAVWVPFGPRLVQGIVLALSDHPLVEDTKEIAQAIDPQPILLPHQIELCRWIAEHYLSSYFEAAALMLPPGFERRVITFFQLTPNPSELTISSLTAQQRRLLSFLQRKGKVELRQLKKVAGRDRIEVVLEQLVRKGLATKTQELERVKVSPRLVTYLKLAVSADQARQIIPSLERKRATQQAKLLKLLATEAGPIPLPEARQRLGFSSAVVQALSRRGLVSIEEVRVQRDPLAHRTFVPASPPTLLAAQEEAWLQVSAAMGQPAGGTVFLLHGVTGSGKTEIYLRALAQAISMGKRAIVLVQRSHSLRKPLHASRHDSPTE